jgi:hypothetical protein
MITLYSQFARAISPETIAFLLVCFAVAAVVVLCNSGGGDPLPPDNL